KDDTVETLSRAALGFDFRDANNPQQPLTISVMDARSTPEGNILIGGYEHLNGNESDQYQIWQISKNNQNEWQAVLKAGSSDKQRKADEIGRPATGVVIGSRFQTDAATRPSFFVCPNGDLLVTNVVPKLKVFHLRHQRDGSYTAQDLSV